MVLAGDIAAAGFKYLGTPYSTMDCQAFIEKCLADCGITMNLPGSNAWYREMTWTGTPEECRRKYGSIPTGAFLFIWAMDGKEPEKYRKDGLGNASHIGIRTATGLGAIHSSASRGCVAESKFSGKSINGGWNRVGLWDRLTYWEKEETPMGTMIATAPDGGTVNLRDAPRKSGERLVKVPSGSSVEVISLGEVWSRVRFAGVTGFMMSEFLKDEDHPDGDMIEVSRQELQEIYKKLGGLLGLGG